MNLLELQDITYSYDRGATTVLNNLSMSFEAGKVYAIMGRSGSGKTTLLSLVSGLNQVQQGQVHFKGIDLSQMDRDSYRSRNIGIVFQSYNLILHLTAFENVLLAMDIAGVYKGNRHERAMEMLQHVELTPDKANRRVLQLSGGEQQRVAIARALSYDPELIIADEPTGNLDGETETQVLDILKRLAHVDGKGVLIVTHSEKVAQYSDVIYRLE